jgi:hypothetical protein
MQIPFTIDQFLQVFEKYNTAVWPAQVVLIVLAVIALAMIFINKNYSMKIINAILGILWIWMGVIYHIIYFSTINPAAKIFGALFIIESLLFIYLGIIKNKIAYNFKFDVYSILGSLFILYALVIYPILGNVFGHIYPQSPTFGAPCPTIIFTFGILLISRVKIPIVILIIPFLWSLVGFSAALNLKVWEDMGLLFAGVTSTTLIIIRNRKLIKQGEIK